MPRELAQLWRATMVILDQGSYSLATFAATVMVARSSGASHLAYFALAQTLLTSSLIVLRCVVGVPFTVMSAGLSAGPRSEYLSASIVFQGGLALLGAAVLTSSVLLSNGDHVFAMAILALAVAGPMILERDFLRSAFLASLDVRRSLWMSAFSNAVAIGVMGVCLSFSTLSAGLALLALGAGAALPVIYYVPRTVKWPSRSALARYGHKNWSFGRHTLAANCLSMAVAQAVPWIVLIADTQEAVAQLAVALGVTGLLRPVTQGLAAYLTPLLARRFVEGGRDAALATSRRAIQLLAIPSLAFMAVIAIFGTPLVRALYTVELSEHWLLELVALSVAIESVAVVMRATARAMRKPAEETVAAGAGALGGALTAGLLVPFVGATGAAAALAANQCAFAVTSFVRIRRSLSAHSADIPE